MDCGSSRILRIEHCIIRLIDILKLPFQKVEKVGFPFIGGKGGWHYSDCGSDSSSKNKYERKCIEYYGVERVREKARGYTK